MAAPSCACVLLALIGLSVAAAEVDPRYDDKDILYGRFPDGFTWGSATSAYQVEGGFDAGGRGESIWDKFTKTPLKIKDNSTGDVACDSYNKYEEDIASMDQMKVQHYRLSISWSRVMADGTNATYRQQGMDYYKNLTKALRAKGIEPLVTMYHWDLPQALQDRGGWLNDSIVDLFEEYAKTCYRELGDQVKWWLTFNEPWVFCTIGYGVGAHAPGLTDPEGVNVYRCTHNVIRSHARAYRAYGDFREKQNGRVSITLNVDYKEPNDSSSEEDQAAAWRAMQFMVGWYAHPIYKNGDYPEVMKAAVHNRSIAQGLSASRLPEFTADEKLLINGTFDYFGLNHYTTGLVEPLKYNISLKSYETDQDLQAFPDKQWERAGSSWLYVVPWGLRKLLRFIRDEYNNPPVIITENGVSFNEDTLDDHPRVAYYRDYINNVLKAVMVDKCNVIGYTAWSLLDNFEWAEGYTERFGLHYVNFTDPDRKRTPKMSVDYLKQLIRDNGFIDYSSTTAAVITTTKSTGSRTASAFAVWSTAAAMSLLVKHLGLLCVQLL